MLHDLKKIGYGPLKNLGEQSRAILTLWLLVSGTSFLEKTLGKVEIGTSNFCFFHSIFYPGQLFAIFLKFKIVVYKLSVWKSLKI